METTKLIVEYLVVGILVSLAIIFLIFSLAPVGIQSVLLPTVQDFPPFDFVAIVLFLPIAYGIGLVAEYLGMTLYERQFEKVKESRFPIFFEQNADWLTKTALLGKLAQGDHAILQSAGIKMYGEMRFFTLMKNAALYAEIQSHLNQARILRTLTIAEALFLAGFIVQFFANGFVLFYIAIFLLLLLFFIFNIRAVLHRFHRYCRSIERSYKMLILDELSNPVDQ